MDSLKNYKNHIHSFLAKNREGNKAIIAVWQTNEDTAGSAFNNIPIKYVFIDTNVSQEVEIVKNYNYTTEEYIELCNVIEKNVNNLMSKHSQILGVRVDEKEKGICIVVPFIGYYPISEEPIPLEIEGFPLIERQGWTYF